MVASRAGLAERIFDRVSPRLAQSLLLRSGCGGRVDLAGEAWGPPAALYETLRVLSYEVGDFFSAHRDQPCEVGHSAEWPHCRSFFSALLYLSDSSDGSAATRFHVGHVPALMPATAKEALSGVPRGVPEDQLYFDQRPSSGSPPATQPVRPMPALCVSLDVVPRRGRVAIFPHQLLHESIIVSEACGKKYTVRADVLYLPPALELPPLDYSFLGR
jgi:hypothetical protein